MRSRIARASQHPLPDSEHARTAHTAASTASLPATSPYDASHSAAVDDADQMILKLHLSHSSGVGTRAKALRDLSGDFFPKALEVSCA